jgi:hypothetical protein
MREKLTKHHVPPRHPDRILIILRKTPAKHIAYHVLFGAAPSLEACIKILKRDWWPEETR